LHQTKERRQELAARQIAGGAEDDHTTRRRGRLKTHTRAQWIFTGRGSRRLGFFVDSDAGRITSNAYGMIFRVGVGGVGGDEVTDPTQRAAGANPETRGDDEPKDTGQNAAVVKLAHTRNDETQ